MRLLKTAQAFVTVKIISNRNTRAGIATRVPQLRHVLELLRDENQVIARQNSQALSSDTLSPRPLLFQPLLLTIHQSPTYLDK